MPDNKCSGGCGSSVTSLSTCKRCQEYLHPGCAPRHRCQSPSMDTNPDSLMQIIKQLQSSVDNMACELKELRKNYGELKTLFSDMKTLKEDNVVLKQQIAALHDRVTTLESTPSNSMDNNNAMNTLANEINDRKSRENNIILFNVPESTCPTRADTYSDDLQNVRLKLNNIKPNITVIKTIRLGIKSDNPRPVKVILECSADAKYVLKNRNKLPHNRTKSDDTPLQQAYLKKIRDELNERIKNGEVDLTLKYINSTPKIVNKPKNHAHSNSH